MADSKRNREYAQKSSAEVSYENTKADKGGTPSKTNSSNTSYSIDAFKEYDVFE